MTQPTTGQLPVEKKGRILVLRSAPAKLLSNILAINKVGVKRPPRPKSCESEMSKIELVNGPATMLENLTSSNRSHYSKFRCSDPNNSTTDEHVRRLVSHLLSPQKIVEVQNCDSEVHKATKRCDTAALRKTTAILEQMSGILG